MSYFVYAFLAETGQVKIGISASPDHRLIAIRTASPVAIKKVFEREVFSDDHAQRIERACHNRLAEKRLHGEWFAIDAREAMQVINEEVAAFYARYGRFRRPGRNKVYAMWAVS